MIKLKSFRITNFRSVADSGWVTLNDVTALIGANEAGKTNILLPLWKLNPAKEGQIIPSQDYPRSLFAQLRNEKPQPTFIETVFELDDEAIAKLKEFDIAEDTSREVKASRRFEGDIEIDVTGLSFKKGGRPDAEAVAKFVRENLPTFVYYSTYGNLDSEIYLPHVVENLRRADLTGKDAARVRTLRVLFEFVKLEPKEILELGRDFAEPNRQPNPTEIAQITEKKKQRSILLQSASADLTARFRAWWKQGLYRFRFEADGNHFRIWVSDDKRPDEIELEGRSSGLQWFFSFFLVFLVESGSAHADAILLLDEPGMSLHPMAQRDLSEFFESLSTTNQLIYTCHSPFLVDADHLDRARKVFVQADGTSGISEDLKAGGGDPSQTGAAYAVHAAIGLTVAESLLLGCEPVIVEGPSDQHYLTAIKTLLTAAGRLKSGRELVFPPAHGAPAVKAVVSILGSREGRMPLVLLDADKEGRVAAKSLKEGLYADAQPRVLDLGMFVTLADAEVEDLIPPAILIDEFDRWQHHRQPFKAAHRAGEPIVPQIHKWAQANGVQMKSPGWKAELAKLVKERLLNDGHSAIDPAVLEQWVKLFEGFRTTT